MALFILSTEEIPQELSALLGASEQLAEGRPYEIAKHFFGIAGGATANSETWRLFAIEAPDPQAVPVLAQVVRQGLEGEESFQLKLEIPAVTAQAVANAARAILGFVAVYRPDPDKTGEIHVPKPR